MLLFKNYFPGWILGSYNFLFFFYLICIFIFLNFLFEGSHFASVFCPVLSISCMSFSTDSAFSFLFHVRSSPHLRLP